MGTFPRADFQRHKNLKLGVKTDAPSPSVTEKKETFYSVRSGDKTYLKSTIEEVNNLLSRLPASARVVKSTRTTTIRTEHKRIK